MLGADIGIDLGTSNVLIYFTKGNGIVLKEPSVVAIDKKSGNIKAVGEEARQMLGRTHDNIIALKPLRGGVISDYRYTEEMLKYFIQKALGRRFLRRPRICICVPSEITEVERRAVREAAKNAGASSVSDIEETIAAAIGAGIDIGRARGSMIIDIGGGTTDVAVISLGHIVVSTSIKVAGDNFDEAIIRYMRKKHNLLIGERSSEELKINIGTAYKRTEPIFMDVRGRNLITGLPKTISVSSEEIQEALSESVASIIYAIHSILENTPPELASDIYDRGIVMTGGGSLLYGFDKLIKEKTGINAIIADEPISCVAIGTGKYIEYCASNKIFD